MELEAENQELATRLAFQEIAKLMPATGKGLESWLLGSISAVWGGSGKDGSFVAWVPMMRERKECPKRQQTA